MFDFLSMMGTHDERKIDTYDENGIFVDTCLVTDGSQPYETAIAHKNYNNGDMVIVESYDTKDEAQLGHEKWVSIMTSDRLPEYLIDCANADIAQLVELVGGELSMRFPKDDTGSK